MDFLLTEGGSWMNILGSIGLIFLGHVANKYIIPYLRIGKREQYARYIAVIADEITNDLKMKYPEKEWLKHLDEAVNSLISICNISPETANRAINASVSRG
jgi:hypothetical protein